MTVEPAEVPGNDCGEGLFPSTLIVKSDGLLVPPPSLTTCFVTTIFPVVTGGGTGLFYTLVIVQFLSWSGFIEPEHPEDGFEV